MDCLVKPSALSADICVLLDQLAAHPCLASSLLFYICDNGGDLLDDEAKAIWDKEFAAEGWLDDELAREDFQSRYVAERVVLTQEQATFTDAFRAMLRAAADMIR